MKIQLTYRFLYNFFFFFFFGFYYFDVKQQLFGKLLNKALFSSSLSLTHKHTHTDFAFQNVINTMPRQPLEFIACKYDECLWLDNWCVYTLEGNFIVWITSLIDFDICWCDHFVVVVVVVITYVLTCDLNIRAPKMIAERLEIKSMPGKYCTNNQHDYIIAGEHFAINNFTHTHIK